MHSLIYNEYCVPTMNIHFTKTTFLYNTTSNFYSTFVLLQYKYFHLVFILKFTILPMLYLKNRCRTVLKSFFRVNLHISSMFLDKMTIKSPRKKWTKSQPKIEEIHSNISRYIRYSCRNIIEKTFLLREKYITLLIYINTSIVYDEGYIYYIININIQRQFLKQLSHIL